MPSAALGVCNWLDANKAPAHNTAWVVRSTIEAAIGGLH
jgi:hypothetical protein